MIHKRRDILNILSRNLPYMQAQLDVVRVGLFGSYARNEATADSDIDILIEFKNKSTLNNFMGVQTLLEEKLDHSIDLATNKAIKPKLRPYIDKDIVYAD